jgi:hypothetical protein
LLITFVTVTLLFGAASTALSLIGSTSGARRLFTARLAQAFGRNVEVSYYGWRWLPWPGVVAHYVTIGEDPRFGEEYFLRAQSVAASPRWRALLSGRLELGALDLVEPSLNLVRNADGRWNVESWLPSPATSKPTLFGPHAPGPAALLSRIDIEHGRINFSRGTDRHPLALADLEGSIEQESPGRWRIELAAHPLRATVHLQNAGMIRVSGYIAGTTSRLQPADLDATWSDASLADMLRLTIGNDPGVRGTFQFELKARTLQSVEGAPLSSPTWRFTMGAIVTGPHRWDIPARQTDPSLSVHAEASWQVGAPQVSLSKLLLEGPHSSVQGTGAIDWAHAISPEIKLESAGVSLADLLDWYRAFQPGVAEGLSADGYLSTSLELRGWPLQIIAARANLPNAAIRLDGSPLLDVVGIEAAANRNTGSISAGLWLGPSAKPSADLLHLSDRARADFPHEWLEGTATFARRQTSARETTNTRGLRYQFRVNAALDHMERLLQAAKALGQSVSNNWDADGGLNAGLEWSWASGEHFPKPTGQVTLRDVKLRLPLINQSIEIADTQIELNPLEQRITVTKASALDAHWQGTISRRDNPAMPVGKTSAKPAANPVFTGWNFDLTADHLDAVELDRWLGPRERPGWFARLFSPQDASANSSSFGSSAAQAAHRGPPATSNAHGILRVGAFHLAPLEVEKLRADVEMQGRTVNLSKFEAQLCSGSISGGLLLNLDADPSYWLHASVANVDAEELGALSTALRGKVAGQLSGEVRISMHGIGKENLLDSLKGAGTLSAKSATIRGFDLSEETPADRVQSDGASEPDLNRTDAQFSLVNAEFSVSARRINFEKIALFDSEEPFEGRGSVDFGQGLQFELWPLPITGAIERDVHVPGARSGPDSAVPRYRVTGSLEAPRVTIEAAPRGTPQTLSQPGPPAVRH